jgi:hypothetical protein
MFIGYKYITNYLFIKISKVLKFFKGKSNTLEIFIRITI